MLIDQVMPTYDATRAQHRTIGRTPERLYRVALDTDFLDAVSSSPMVRALFGRRALIERIVALVRRPPYEPPPPPGDAPSLGPPRARGVGLPRD